MAGAHQPAIELERRDHDRPSTETSPDALSTCTLYGASERGVSPRTLSLPDVLSASRS